MLDYFGDSDVAEDDDVEEYQPLKKRTEIFCMIEDTCLVRAWSHVSIDGATGSDETGKLYWQHMEAMFLKLIPREAMSVERSFQSLQRRWDVITSCCSRWADTMEQVRAHHRSVICIKDYVGAF
jgi:hypothetical protein